MQIPELVGHAVLDTIGLVLPSPDATLNSFLPPHDGHALGMISSRTGAAGQIIACDNAVKRTGANLVSVELPRDTKGWGGYGCYIVLSASDPATARDAVSFALAQIERNAGEVYISDAGHLEFAYTASADAVVHAVFDAPIGKAFGFLAASPAAIGMVCADYACKSAPVTPVSYRTPSVGTSHSNEVILAFTGESEAVLTAVRVARDVGMTLLRGMGSEPLSPGKTRVF